jgi:hypothetical protein
MKPSNRKKSWRTDRPTLPELDQTKRSVLNSLASLQSRRSYQHAIERAGISDTDGKDMSAPLLEEVFKTSGVPTFTFVEPSEYTKLLVGLRTPGRGVVIEGPSGIGRLSPIRPHDSCR